ncbi:hypothetical protein M3G91_20890, partial [Micromonospora chalcea]|uniref:hypothetical protein n=1 Tax=Micromonospora chalcea TaxID=1874 RepID=UPI0021A5B3A6
CPARLSPLIMKLAVLRVRFVAANLMIAGVGAGARRQFGGVVGFGVRGPSHFPVLASPALGETRTP